MKYTKKLILTLTAALFLLANFAQGSAQQGAQFDPNAAENLDLYAVAELFKDSENLEKFEQALNNPADGINNLDLNNDNEIDFIRVTEQTKSDTRLIVLQAVLGDNEFQDVATIAVEKENGDGKYNVQIQGDTVIYGANYYVVPANSNFSAWNVVRWLFRPNYRVYVSPYAYRVYPTWWSVRRPVAVNIYRTRVSPLAVRRNFVTTKTVRVINNSSYRPRTSTLVTRRINTARTTTQVRTNNQSGGMRTTTTTRTKTTNTRGRRN